jgi:hypothetical protein
LARGEFAQRGTGDRELADWAVGHTCVLQDGNDQAKRRGQEDDPDEQRAFDDARCVKHDADDQIGVSPSQRGAGLRVAPV